MFARTLKLPTIRIEENSAMQGQDRSKTASLALHLMWALSLLVCFCQPVNAQFLTGEQNCKTQYPISTNTVEELGALVLPAKFETNLPIAFNPEPFLSKSPYPVCRAWHFKLSSSINKFRALVGRSESCMSFPEEVELKLYRDDDNNGILTKEDIAGISTYYGSKITDLEAGDYYIKAERLYSYRNFSDICFRLVFSGIPQVATQGLNRGTTAEKAADIGTWGNLIQINDFVGKYRPKNIYKISVKKEIRKYSVSLMTFSDIPGSNDIKLEAFFDENKDLEFQPEESKFSLRNGESITERSYSYSPKILKPGIYYFVITSSNFQYYGGGVNYQLKISGSQSATPK